MNEFVAGAWQETLHAAGLDGFEALWALDAPWFEPPNRRRGGWSGVIRFELPLPEGGSVGMFLKRQENHLVRTPSRPLGEPSCAVEMRNLQILQRVGVPSLEPVYFGQRKVAGKRRALLMTRELRGFRPLDEWTAEWQAEGWARSTGVRRRVIAECATMLSQLHQAGLVHNTLYPKHIFVRLDEHGQIDLRLIDLEKMRRKRRLARRTLRDLDSLNRRSRHCSRTDRLRFLKAYLGVERLDASGRATWRRLAQAYERKTDGHG
jgi:hypothetical protein